MWTNDKTTGWTSEVGLDKFLALKEKERKVEAVIAKANEEIAEILGGDIICTVEMETQCAV